MPYAIGAGLALFVSVFARISGFDRDRAFYATVLIVVASIYVLFATVGGSTRALVFELAGMSVFASVAVVGFKRSSGLVAAGLAGHGVFDVFHGRLIDNAGVPGWWPAFCMAYDIAAGAALAFLLSRRGAAPAAHR
jgi:hypothetical protein